MPGRNAVFVDSSGWIALLNADDRWHSRALEEFRQVLKAGCPVFTTDWVFAESGNGLARTSARLKLPAAVEKFSASPTARLVRTDGGLFRDALDLYARATDKSWGLVDCASFVVMRRMHILDAFTTDRHFEQAGFRRLLTPKPR
ncbi:MAG: type II toxin-antitoxin system VapC family toxin [Pirellulales bacterium]|nr:type II toxin-antitoxin system VapC family toxin [Pirellulales bacterium]